MSVYVIAELGSCHDGSIDRMLKGVHAAADAGADCLKLQWTSDPDEMAQRRGKAVEDGYADVYRKYLTWPKGWHRVVSDMCTSRKIDYACTVYLEQDIEVVAPFVSCFKVSSFEAKDKEFIDAILKLNLKKRIYVSTGMMESSEVWKIPRDYLIRPLHCVSSYPAPVEELNLCVIGSHGRLEGYWDHSDPSFTQMGGLAVAHGAKVIEAHLRVDTTDVNNPDYPHAMSPLQFAVYVEQIRFAETAGGSNHKRVQPSEAPMSRYRV